MSPFARLHRAYIHASIWLYVVAQHPSQWPHWIRRWLRGVV